MIYIMILLTKMQKISSFQYEVYIFYTIIKATFYQMSFFIEMLQTAQESHQDSVKRLLSQQIIALIHHPQFNVAVIIQQTQRMIQLGLPKGQLAFIRDTKWKIEILNTHLRFTVSFMDYTGLNYVRGHSQRIKLQVIILMKLINSRLPMEQEYYLQPNSGIVRYNFVISLKDYQQKLKGIESLRKLFKYILSQLNLFSEVILLCEPSSNPPNSSNPEVSQIQDVNRYRFLLRNVRKFRQNGLSYMSDLLDIKQQIKQSNSQNQMLKKQLDQIRFLFQSNLQAFEQMRLGLEDGEKDYEKIASCIKRIGKNAKGEQSRPPQFKIVNGIKILKSGDIKSLSKQGAHSQIFRGKFIFKQSPTTNLQVAQSNSLWLDGNQQRAELILKKCNTHERTSVNSFLNEIHFLNHIRDAKSSYIAKYFLELKNFQDRNEYDIIYMKPYYHNLHGLIKKSQTLSIMERLGMIYKLSKGLCFLNYWSVLHRDFKPHNIMIDQHLNPVIIDFGSCAPILRSSNFTVPQERLLTTRMFHIYYHELPEEYADLKNKFTREEYNRHPLFDVYSFGRVISYLFFNSITPPSPDDLQAYPYPELLKNILFLITICLQVDPDQRPAFAEITGFLGKLQCYILSIQKDIASRSKSLQPKKQPLIGE